MFTGRRVDFLDGNKLLSQYNRGRYYDYYMGRFYTPDPFGYIGGMNLYEYVLSNPLTYRDPWGLYEIEWEGRWDDADKTRILSSMQRVKARIKNHLIKDIDREVSELEKDECCKEKECCKNLIKELEKLEKVLLKISSGIDSKGHNLEIYQHKFDSDVTAYTKVYLFLLDDELHLNTHKESNWHNLGSTTLDEVFIHELSHLYGTEDDDSEGYFRNAHVIDDLIERVPTRIIYYRYDKLKCLGKK